MLQPARPTFMFTAPTQRLSFAEYVTLIAMLSSIVALGTDMMLPALDQMGQDFRLAHANDVHYVVTVFFLGMASGQIIVGPLSDSLGRKSVINADKPRSNSGNSSRERGKFMPSPPCQSQRL